MVCLLLFGYLCLRLFCDYFESCLIVEFLWIFYMMCLVATIRFVFVDNV